MKFEVGTFMNSDGDPVYDVGRRLLDSQYTWDLDAGGIDLIDVEIRDVITAMRRLPLVKRTLFSCAGIGRFGTGPRHLPDAPADDPDGHGPRNTPYLCVAYRPESDYDAFHDQITAAVGYGVLHDANVASYRVTDAPKDQQARIVHITAAWNRVRAVITGFTPQEKP